MLSFKLWNWSAYAPGLESIESWADWLKNKYELPIEPVKPSLKQIPAMLRRRFTNIGRCAVGAAMPMLAEGEHRPLVFASRHGDIDLTLSLLESIANNEPLSPTGFSLAVHNAVSGLISIARKDPSNITSMAATENLIPLALLEAATLLQENEQVLCIICDTPLPDLYRSFSYSSPFPYAVAMILSREGGEPLSIENKSIKNRHALQGDDLEKLIALLCHHSNSASFAGTQCHSEWIIQR